MVQFHPAPPKFMSHDSRQRYRYIQCDRKRRYEPWLFLTALAHAEYLTNTNKQQFCVYACDICGGLHVGRNPRRHEIRKLKQILHKMTKYVFIEPFISRAPLVIVQRTQQKYAEVKTRLAMLERMTANDQTREEESNNVLSESD